MEKHEELYLKVMEKLVRENRLKERIEITQFYEIDAEKTLKSLAKKNYDNEMYKLLKMKLSEMKLSF